MASRVVLELHGARAIEGVEIDALETFIGHFRAALREYDRGCRGSLARRGGRPDARDAAASAFRLVEFHTGSGIATLESARIVDELAVLDAGEDLSLSTLRALLGTIEAGERMPDPILESLDRARRAIGDDGSFGVAIEGDRPLSRTVIDEQRIDRLRRPAGTGDETTLRVTGRLHMIETDQPQRRIGIRAQDGVDWTCSYPDNLHRVVTTLIEQLVRVTGTGRRLTATAGRLRIEQIEAIPEHVQDVLFTDEPVPLEQLRAEQGIERPQGLAAFVDQSWQDDDHARLFLEATLGITHP